MLRFPLIRGSLARAKRNHLRLEQIARKDFGGGFLIEPFGWFTAWGVALWP